MTMRDYRALWSAAWLLAAAAGVLAFGALGAWQWSRGEHKQALLAAQAAALQAAPVALAKALADDARVQRGADSGTLRTPLLLLDNQRRGDAVGVRAYGVAATAQGEVLVDLGWLPLPGDRSLPAVAPPRGRVELRGLLVPWPGQGLRLGENPWPAALESPPLLSYLDAGEIERAFEADLPARVLRLDPAFGFGWERDLELLPNTLPPERHRGYAVQWWGLSATVAIVYLVLTARALRRRKATP